MEDLKIRVTTEQESKEAQELFFELGGVWSQSENTSYIAAPMTYIYFNGSHIYYAHDDENDDHWFSCESSGKELTIQQLRDLVVLKRNDVVDATHIGRSGSQYYIGAELYFWDGMKWEQRDFSNLCHLKPIEKKEMKEYLELQEDGGYKLVLRGDNCLESDIAVPPSGVNSYNYLYENGINLAWTENPASHYGELLWQRSVTEEVQGYGDSVNNPSHYSDSAIECIDAMEAMLTPDQFVGYLRGNMFKYQWRYQKKNGVEDLKKSQWYLNKLIEVEDARS